MPEQDPPYDPFIPSGGQAAGSQQAGGAGGDTRIKALQTELNNTSEVLKSNMRSLGDRGDKLDSLQNKTDNLAVSAQSFRSGANRVRKQMWWKDMKMRMCIIIGIIVLLAIIIIPIAVTKG